MKIDILMPTYNRFNLVQRAIRSVLQQTSPDWELWVYDDGSDYDFNKIREKFQDERIHFFVGERLTDEQRAASCRYSVINNFLLNRSSNELISYLCDDDYYWPEAIEGALSFFKRNPTVYVAYGKLTYSFEGREEEPREKRDLRFPGTVLKNPFNKVDHNQVVHRRECLKVSRWIEDPATWNGSDAYFFLRLASVYPFYPMDVWFANKYLHRYCNQNLKGTWIKVRE